MNKHDILSLEFFHNLIFEQKQKLKLRESICKDHNFCLKLDFPFAFSIKISWESWEAAPRTSDWLSRCQVVFTKICHYFYCHNCYCHYCHYNYCHNLSFWVLSQSFFLVLSQLQFLIWSQFYLFCFLHSFVTIWVFEFGNDFSI